MSGFAGSETVDYSLDCWKVAEQAVEHGERILLYGPPGTGKTTMACLHALNGRGLSTITMTEETPAESLRGHWTSDGNGGLAWMHGPAMVAWDEGQRLVINEIDHACGDAQDLMHVICDDKTVAALTLPNLERTMMRPNDGFQVIATMNGTPETLPDAIQDRFAVQILIDTPHPKAVASLPSDLRKFARKTVAVTDPARRIGIRKWKAFAHLRQAMTNQEIAAQAVFGRSWRSLVAMMEMYG